MRQIRINDRWINGIPTKVGQRYRYSNGAEWSYGTYAPEAAVDMRITKLAFKQRFTAAERIAIREAAKTVPEVYDFEDLVNSAAFIDLARPDTIAAVQHVETAGLIAVGRADVILYAHIEDVERWKG
jgi:hypothetical protein